VLDPGEDSGPMLDDLHREEKTLPEIAEAVGPDRPRSAERFAATPTKPGATCPARRIA